MTKQCVTDKVKVAATALHLVVVDCELASVALSLMEVELWFQLENKVADLDTDVVEFGGNLIAWGHDLAEVVIVDAIDVHAAKVLLPLFSQEVEGLFWDPKVGASCIDDGWVLLLVAKLEFFAVVEHVSSLQSPLFYRVHPIGSIRHCLYFLEASNTANDLISVKSSENAVRRVT